MTIHIKRACTLTTKQHFKVHYKALKYIKLRHYDFKIEFKIKNKQTIKDEGNFI